MEKEKHLQMIQLMKNDLHERGETLVGSSIKFMGCIYELKVKKEGRKTPKTVYYTFGPDLHGFRKIEKP